jgi:hypothetical protein
MATRTARLAEFNGEGEPPAGVPVELLCEDHCGTYALRFACQWVDGAWYGCDSGERILSRVVGWRQLRSLNRN